MGATAGDVNEAPSPHADLKKQRHDEKQVKKPKAEKKDELRKKSKEMKARMAHPETSLIGLKTENVAVVKDHRKTNDATSAFLEGKLAPSLKSPPLVFAQNESSYHQDGSEFNRSIESDRYAASAALLPSGSNPHTSTTLGRTESSSSVEDIHAVAEKLPSRNKDSYPVFIPGKGVVIVPVSPGAADVQWKAAPQQSQQINFSPGSSGHKAVGHGYNSSAGSSFPTSANQGVMGPALSGTNWGAELDQFSQFSGANGQNWQREPFIESVEAEAIHSRTGRNNPSSSRLQVGMLNLAYCSITYLHLCDVVVVE